LSALIRARQYRSLEAIGVSAEQALADLARLKNLIHSRQLEEQDELQQMYLRCTNARKPAKEKRFEVAYLEIVIIYPHIIAQLGCMVRLNRSPCTLK
jgi:hypothetical protein